ncbi:hypothetical protein ACP70R_003725 [Stipagrostis hirtigluma subsp. patula]
MSRSRQSSAAAASGEDRLGALPDDALLRVLSLLPSDDAVRTCVLARRWRHLWRSAPALRVARDDGRPWSAQWLNRFVTHFLLLRDRAPLDECGVSFYLLPTDDPDAEVFRFFKLWICHAVSLCQARALRVSIVDPVQRPGLADARLVSRHLTRVELGDVELGSWALDFSGCTALEDLEMTSCSIEGRRILLPSVKRLKIICCDFNVVPRTSISAPNVVSLELSDHGGFTPLLQSMPSFVTAFVRFDERCDDICSNSYFGDCGDDECDGCYGDEDDDDYCVLLEGLSGATNLELIAQPEVAPEPIAQTDEWYNSMDGSLVSKHLKVVEVKYHDDAVLNKLLMVLNTCGVPSEKVAFRKMNSLSSEKFSFEQKDED